MNADMRGNSRILWLDSLRGVTVLLVVLHHSFQTTIPWMNQFGTTQVHWIMMFQNDAFSHIRMPAFFLCSGALFAVAMRKGWNWFLRVRVLFALWVIVLWTLLFNLLEAEGFNLFPASQKRAGGAAWETFLWQPYHHLWFIYAIAILGAFAMAVRNLALPVQLLVTCAVIGLLVEVTRAVDFPYGVHLLLTSLWRYGFPFFMSGILLGRYIRTSASPGTGLAAVALIGLMSGFLALKLGLIPGDRVLRLLYSIPMTFAAVTVLRWILARWDWLTRQTARIGAQSLEIFILHMIGIAAASTMRLPQRGSACTGAWS